MARRALTLVASLGLLMAAAAPAAAWNGKQNRYTVHNLQSDIPGLAAATDPDLVNGWGIAAGPASGPATPWWVSDNGTSKSTLYNGNTGAKLGLVVTIPGAPTGVVFNGTADFQVNAGTGLKASLFIFDTDTGQIAGWNGVGTVAINKVTTANSKYTGLAIGSTGGKNYLYAANFITAHVDVFDGSFTPATLAGDFVDPRLPQGYAPFGIQAIGNEIFVAYAKQSPDKHDEVVGKHRGFVSVFGMDGTFHGRVASRGVLDAPWGLAKAPANFGKFSGDLLVGNFGDGRIHAYKWTSDGWKLHGTLRGPHDRPIVIEGLWGIGFGNGGAAGPTNTLYFAAGTDEEEHGLFGSITAP